jgi:hypothetical protein
MIIAPKHTYLTLVVAFASFVPAVAAPGGGGPPPPTPPPPPGLPIDGGLMFLAMAGICLGYYFFKKFQTKKI